MIEGSSGALSPHHGRAAFARTQDLFRAPQEIGAFGFDDEQAIERAGNLPGAGMWEERRADEGDTLSSRAGSGVGSSSSEHSSWTKSW